MRYFREQGASDEEVIDNLNAKFGENYQVMTRKTIKLGGILGIGRRSGVEYFGYVIDKKSGPKTTLRETAAPAGSNKQRSNKGREGFQPPSAEDLAEKDRHSRDEILARFAKNKEVQKLLNRNIEEADAQQQGRPDKGIAQNKGPETSAWPQQVKGENPYHQAKQLPPQQIPVQQRGQEYKGPAYYSEQTGKQAPNYYPPYPAENNRAAYQAGGYHSPHQEGGSFQQQAYHDGYTAPPQALGAAGQYPPLYSPQLEHFERSLMQRMENLERKLDRRGGREVEPMSMGQLREGLYQNEFPPFFVDRLLQQMKRELPLEELENLERTWEYVLLNIAENLRFWDPERQAKHRVLVLIGPTGVGKTTTIAKLAARQCVAAIGGTGTKRVHLITLDNYRIGAQDQIRTYGEILGAEVDCIETYEALENCIRQDTSSDTILIDTVGRSPKDHVKLAEMRRFLEASGGSEIHLAMSAVSSAGSMRDIITEFKPFGFNSVILTKMDEASRIGGSLATLLQEDVPLSYMTTGQKVPQDICDATAGKLFQHLVDVRVNWNDFNQKLEENMLY